LGAQSRSRSGTWTGPPHGQWLPGQSLALLPSLLTLSRPWGSAGPWLPLWPYSGMVGPGCPGGRAWLKPRCRGVLSACIMPGIGMIVTIYEFIIFLLMTVSIMYIYTTTYSSSPQQTMEEVCQRAFSPLGACAMGQLSEQAALLRAMAEGMTSFFILQLWLFVLSWKPTLQFEAKKRLSETFL